jgi:hypothetical protein
MDIDQNLNNSATQLAMFTHMINRMAVVEMVSNATGRNQISAAIGIFKSMMLGVGVEIDVNTLRKQYLDQIRSAELSE